MAKRYRGQRTEEERARPHALTDQGTASARSLSRAFDLFEAGGGEAVPGMVYIAG